MEKEIQLKFTGAQRYIFKSFVLSDQLSKTQSYSFYNIKQKKLYFEWINLIT